MIQGTYSRFSENYYGVVTGMFTVIIFALVILLLWGIPTISSILNSIL